MKLFSLCSPIRVFVRACLQARLHRVLQKFNQLMSVSVKKVQYYFFNFMKWCTRVENWQRNYIHMQQSTSMDIMDLWAIDRFLADLSIIHKYTFDINNPLLTQFEMQWKWKSSKNWFKYLCSFRLKILLNLTCIENTPVLYIALGKILLLKIRMRVSKNNIPNQSKINE